MPADAAVTKTTGGRWTRIAPPLMCGLTVDLSLVLLPFRPPLERLAGILIVVSVAVLAIGHELRQAKGEREAGRIELGSVRRRGIVCQAMVIPYPDHVSLAWLLMAMLLGGMVIDVLLLPSVQPIRHTTPRLVVVYASGAYAGLLAKLAVLSLLRRSYFVALLPEGIVCSLPGMGSFVPWEVIQEVRLAKVRRLGLAGRLCAGIRVADLERVGCSARMLRRVKALQARSHWICFWPAGIALSPRKLALLVESYRVHPGERPKIGTAAELEEVQAALAGIPSG